MVDHSWGNDAGGGECGDSLEDLGKITDDELQKKKPRRVRKQDIEELQEDRRNETEKFISIWHREEKHDPLRELMPKFPRKAAIAFSEVWRKQLDNGASVLIIEDCDMAPYKRILDWINLCIDEGNDVKFPEIEAENALHAALDVIAAANYIQVPGMSLQEHLKKDAARKYARKALIELDYVARIYDVDNADSFGENEAILQEAAATSIFEAWWSGVLDDEKYDEYCMYVEQMRVKFPKLDEDINARLKDKVEFIEKKREERRAGKTNNGGVDGAADGGYGPTNGPDGGWGNAAVGTGETITGEWAAGDSGGTGAAASSTGDGEWSATAEGGGEPATATEEGSGWGNSGCGW